MAQEDWWGENQDEQHPEHQMNLSKQEGNCWRKAGCPVSELLPGTPDSPVWLPAADL